MPLRAYRQSPPEGSASAVALSGSTFPAGLVSSTAHLESEKHDTYLRHDLRKIVKEVYMAHGAFMTDTGYAA